MSDQSLSKIKQERLGLLFLILPAVIIIIALFGLAFLPEIKAINPSFERVLRGLMVIMMIVAFQLFIPFIFLGIGYLYRAKKDLKVYDKRSGKGIDSGVPSEILGWNWGAAGLGVFWGLYHRVWSSVLMLIPIIGLVWWIPLGLYGSEWAWKKNRWESLQAFKNSQNKWRPWGIFLMITKFVIVSIGFYYS